MAERYPEPFYEPFTTLSWLAGPTSRVRSGTTVLVLPYRHPRCWWRARPPTSTGSAAAGWCSGWASAGRAVGFGDARHPLRLPLPRMREALEKHPVPAFAPRIALRLTTTPVDDPDRPAGVGALDQVLDDLEQLQRLGADTVVLDPYHGDPEETRRPDAAWRALTAVATHRRTPS